MRDAGTVALPPHGTSISATQHRAHLVAQAAQWRRSRRDQLAAQRWLRVQESRVLPPREITPDLLAYVRGRIDANRRAREASRAAEVASRSGGS